MNISNKIKVCFFGTYDKQYSSNKIILDGLKQNNVEIVEVGIDTRISKLNDDKDLGFVALFKRILIKLKLIPLVIKNFKEIQKCDVLFVGYPGHLDLILAIIVAKLTGTKLVFYPLIILYITFTEDVRLFTKNSIKAKILKIYEKIIYSFPDVIIADIPFQKKVFVELFNVPEKKIQELPIGADESIYKNTPKEKDNFFNVVYYGLYSPLHGTEHIIAAASKLTKHKDIRFLMVGKGQTYERDVKNAKKLNLKNVIFYSEMDESSAFKTLQSADVFMGFMQKSPTVHRALPNKVYQGLALGKTVITADTAASRAVFKDRNNAYLCKIADGKDLAKSILDLRNNPKLNNKIARNGYKLFNEAFSKKAIGKTLKGIFSDVVGLEVAYKTPTLSIGIPTYEGGKSLVATLNSIYKQSHLDKIKKILVVVDGNKIERSILQKIKNKKLTVLYKEDRQGQATRINDIFKSLNSEYILLANDDVLLEKNAVKNILSGIAHNPADLYSCSVMPLKGKNTFQKIIRVGFDINELIAKTWNAGNNYLSCNGRGVVLSKNLYKKMTIPTTSWNNDAYMYLYCVMHSYKFNTLQNSYVYYQLPSTFKEHEKQSTKFAYSLLENKKYFRQDIDSFYVKPFLISLSSFIKIFVRNPFISFAYAYLLVYTRLKNSNIQNLFVTSYWETDRSTKLA